MRSGDSQELTPMEILRRAVEVGRAIRSVRIRSTHISVKGRERSYTGTEEIRVGEDSYRRTTNGGLYRERLEYKGESYTRSHPDDDWRRPVGEVEVPMQWIREPDPHLYSELYSFDFSALSAIDRLEDQEIEGRRMVHLAGGFPHHFLGRSDLEDMRRRLAKHVAPPNDIVPPAVRDRIAARMGEFLDELEDQIEDSASGSIEVWVSEGDYLIYRMEITGTFDREGRETWSYRKGWEFSDFNEPLELPGPLPRT